MFGISGYYYSHKRTIVAVFGDWFWTKVKHYVRSSDRNQNTTDYPFVYFPRLFKAELHKHEWLRNMLQITAYPN